MENIESTENTESTESTENRVIADTALTAEEIEFFERGGDDNEPDDAGDEPEAEVEAETSEVSDDGAADDITPKPPKGYVRHEALHEAREQNRELRERLDRENERIRQFESLRAELDQLRHQRSQADTVALADAQAKAQKAAEERYQEDPVGYLRDQNAMLVHELTEVRNQQQNFLLTQQQSVQEAAQMRALTHHVNQLETAFRQQVPEYDDAFRFVQERRLNDFAAIGITDPQEQQRNLYQEILGLSGKAIQEGRNPAEVLYALAKNWGFSAPAPPAASGEQESGVAANKSNGKLDRIQRGMKVATSLSDSGGAPSEKGLNLADIERMSDDDFDKLWSEMERESH